MRRKLEKEVVAYFTILFQQLFGNTEEITDIGSFRVSGTR
jgi:hypothetical protein